MSAFNNALRRLAESQWQSGLRQLNRGIEREALRIVADGHLAQDDHPENLGSALTHPWITTDFSESLLEMITPVYHEPDDLLTHLADTHTYVLKNIGEQRLWPLSMPCFIDNNEPIPIAYYGHSHIGRMKTLYRIGLKHRYGAKMQAISGLHFNFSVPMSLWPAFGVAADDQPAISARYFSLLRYVKRHVWVLAYLFGASPALCRSFVEGRDLNLPFQERDRTLYLPHATSLRMSDLGYTNSAQEGLNVSLNSLEQYIEDLKQAISLPSEEFAEIGVRVDGQFRQLNANVLQIENELYSPVRPKRTASSKETPSDALKRGGVEYVEVRAMDINPFSPIGIDRSQILLLDLFLLNGLLLPQPDDNEQGLEEQKANWKTVIMEGRRPGVALSRDGECIPLSTWLSELMDEWQQLAKVLDEAHGDTRYTEALAEWRGACTDPEQTLSGRVLKASLATNHGCWAGDLAAQHRETLLARPYQLLSEQQLKDEVEQSHRSQAQIELADKGTFDEFLLDYFGSDL